MDHNGRGAQVLQGQHGLVAVNLKTCVVSVPNSESEFFFFFLFQTPHHALRVLSIMAMAPLGNCKLMVTVSVSGTAAMSG